jgi:hypothetical protein
LFGPPVAAGWPEAFLAAGDDYAATVLDRKGMPVDEVADYSTVGVMAIKAFSIPQDLIVPWQINPFDSLPADACRISPAIDRAIRQGMFSVNGGYKKATG